MCGISVRLQITTMSKMSGLGLHREVVTVLLIAGADHKNMATMITRQTIAVCILFTTEWADFARHRLK